MAQFSMSERTIALTRNSDGTYLAERDGERITVPVSQRLGVETIDRARAEYEATEAFSDLSVRLDPADPTQQDAEDRARADAEYAELQAALVRWKVPAYDKLVTDAGRNPPAELLRKRDYWHSRVEGTR